MLESLDYIRQNCLEKDPHDEEYKHDGGKGKTKVLRVNKEMIYKKLRNLDR
jgi:hypothetical protein